MKKVPALMVAALVATAATGCATTQPLDASSPSPRFETPRYEVDGEYVSAVERKARRQGVQVIWLKMPLRPGG